MPDVKRQPKSRPSATEEFRPHRHYPSLNAAAGLDEATPRKVKTPRRPNQPPRARIRLDSVAAAPTLRWRGDSKPRAARRERVGLKSNGRWLSLVGMIGMAVLLYWLLASATFQVTKAEIKGSRFLKSPEALKVSGADKANIFTLNEQEVVTKLSALPYIQTVKVSKALPDRLVIEVEERSSAVNWRVGSTSYLVDREGIVLEAVFEKDLSSQARNFAVVESLDDRRLKLGDRVDPAAVRSAPVIQQQLAQVGVKIAAVQYSPAGGLLVVSDTEGMAWKALFGTDAQLDKKISILKGLLSDKSIKWSYADLRFVNKPAIQ